MSSRSPRLRRMLTLAVLAGTGMTVSPPWSGRAADNPPSQPAISERIGIYDSRSIAVAYAGSEFQRQRLSALKARLGKAAQAGDTQEVARIKEEGKTWQAGLHRQGFGTAPVEDLLSHLREELPAIRKRVDVSLLVSKWDQLELDRHPKAARVDVTAQLVDAFHPTPEQRRRALKIQETSPVRGRK